MLTPDPLPLIRGFFCDVQDVLMPGQRRIRVLARLTPKEGENAARGRNGSPTRFARSSCFRLGRSGPQGCSTAARGRYGSPARFARSSCFRVRPVAAGGPKLTPPPPPRLVDEAGFL